MTMMIVGISIVVFMLFVFMLMTFILLDALIKERKRNENYYKKLRRSYDIRISELQAEVEVRDTILDAYGIRR